MCTFESCITHSLQAPSDGGEACRWERGVDGGTGQGTPYSHATTLLQPDKSNRNCSKIAIDHKNVSKIANRFCT